MRARALAILSPTITLALACGGGGTSPGDGGPDPFDAPTTAPVGPVSGWISLLEQTGPFAGTFAYADIAAGAGTPGRYYLDRLTEIERSGACRALKAEPIACDPICPANWICLAGNRCRYGYTQDVGTIAITGAAVDIEMPFLGFYGTGNGELPADVFGPGDAITASAPGGSGVPAFSVAATGVAPLDLDLPGGQLALVDGVDTTLAWTPSSVPAQIWFVVAGTFGHGGSPRAAIECTGPDTGSLTIPGSLLHVLPPLVAPNCQGLTCTRQVLRRYTETTAQVGDGTVRFVVGDDVTFWATH